MKQKKNSLLFGMAWKPLFAAAMTGILAKSSSIDPILIGLLLGIAAAAACWREGKKWLDAVEKETKTNDKLS